MHVPLLAWIILFVVIIGVLTFDFFAHVRKDHFPSLRESAAWTIIYISIALVAGLVISLTLDWDLGGQYFAGWVTEWSLSLDNLFVFVIIIAAFKAPREVQQKIIAVGITLALVFRLIFILLGAALIEHFSWIFYIFGLFLLFTALQQIREGSADAEEEAEYKDNFFVSGVRRIFPVTPDYVGHQYFAKIDGKRHITPFLLVVVAVGSADVMFAVDSIPAIFGLTNEAFIVFAANAFALMGLRQLYFLIEGLMERLIFLHYGLAAILGFIGAKLIIHALSTNEIPFINGGQPFTGLPEASNVVSLGYIVAVLIITAVVSLLVSRRRQKNQSNGTVQNHPDA
ncbi:TerC/Alx family metal homeostasis membrane protein [Mobiluncus curtisii]|uniref:TerC/Alx family metal homeostasis membrane protein n=1 Tax=Mobiluncus curtisii TaxID=2051 RepID=UPI00146FD274|nr:TerC/Alx family metal homeostasis membrane protein [Mobiluncus curtisii]NMW44622.1 TerC/Alx family metal homeostasis membrane protein [Mobiluncus curtisii]NMW83524.1 TerC/Alx family metal homeostasis membrane protein [Mobiluncus curtisii]NMW89286.1 TerC/Alx family metal homeostasis membrane protein [Mobiluncus curtisii]NMW99964.1 TerC/Alx family metal homeostasis membrane protein [Mobiluncus curtisii]NMX04987.1 TerC/Alx family metal homeostasis membrane protein [Mobiluncus curtisii]